MLKILKEYTRADGKLSAVTVTLDGLEMTVCSTGRVSGCSNWSALWDSSNVIQKDCGSECFGHISFTVKSDIKNNLFGGKNEKL